MKNILSYSSALVVLFLGIALGACSSTTPPPDPTNKFAIKGKVKATTTESVSGVTVAVPSKSATTDATGAYSITDLDNGSYVVTPSKAGMTFTPATQTVAVSGADTTISDFVAKTIPTYEVPEMVAVEPGTFMMGAVEGQLGGGSKVKPVHQVTFTKGLWVGKYEVTQKQYESVMGLNPTVSKGPNKPVGDLNIIGMVAYCNKLSELEGLTPPYTVNGTSIQWNRTSIGYRLPTSAEWEYFARAGTTDNTYAGISDGKDPNIVIDPIAWYRENSIDGSGERVSQPVGLKMPNAWGIYDVLGNIAEFYFESPMPYTAEAQTDPWRGFVSENIITRGGNYSGFSSDCYTSTYRAIDPFATGDGMAPAGFRVVRSR
ncbi:MAG: SUMF1/EgtB/PvdO family nonheme iron enzyme [Ignavibacteria bacterium]|nr:SUMF1/EgtB/PvdO family nonheme iron enzyme [Ignavibacteria bacterium]